MKKFLAIYTGTADALAKWREMAETQRQQREADGMKAWMAWGEKHADALVDLGAPLGKTKRVSADGIADVRNNIGGYVVVRAESHEAAARMFENHPHFSIFPGDGVEIMECLPLPPRE